MKVKEANIGSDLQKGTYWPWLFLSTLMIALFYRLGYLELSGEEPRRAMVAWEMLQSKSYLVPHLYGLEYYNKPPMHSWLLAGIMPIFGLSEFVVRLPGVLSFLGIGWMLYRWMKTYWGQQPARLASMIYLTSADLILYTTIYAGELDLTFSLMMLINAIGIFKIGRDPSSAAGYLMAYLALLAAILTKGWVAIPFHLFALSTWSVYHGHIRKLLNLKHFFAIIGLFSSLGVYYWQYSQSGNLSNLLLNNFIESGSKVTDISLVGILNQLIECPLACLKISAPWTLLLIAYLKKDIRQFIKSQDTLIFSAIYILSNMWIYWIFIDVRDRYLYPFIPFICVLIVGVIYQKQWWPSKRKFIYGVMAIMIGLRMLYDVFAMPLIQEKQFAKGKAYRALATELITRSNHQPIDVLVPPETKTLPFIYQGISSIDHPPIIPYQIPYYLSQQTKNISRYAKEAISGKYYLVLADQVEVINEGEVLFEFTEAWYNQKVMLWRKNQFSDSK